MRAPALTVLMAVYNAEKYLCQSLESVLAQTYADFEFVIVDDGSSDGTSDLLHACRDARLRVTRNHTNMGLTRSLNIGLGIAQGKYIARMDADDVCAPERLGSQVRRLEECDHLSALGTAFAIVDDDGNVLEEPRTVPESLLAWHMAWRNVLCHSSMMMRRDAIESLGGYDPAIRYAQDYDLWTRMIMRGGRIGVLPQNLLVRRETPSQISKAKGTEQFDSAIRTATRYVSWLLRDAVPETDVRAMCSLLNQRRPGSLIKVCRGLRLIHRLFVWAKANCESDEVRAIERIQLKELRATALSCARRQPCVGLVLLLHANGLAPGTLARRKASA